MKNNFIISIDLGVDGGIALHDGDKLILKYSMPRHIVTNQTDFFELERIFAEIKTYTRHSNPLVVMEKIHAMRGNAAKSMHTFALHIGRMTQLLVSWFKVEPVEVTARKWQKWIFEHCECEEIKDAKGKRETKKMADVAIRKLYPNRDFRKSERAKIYHSGIVDAVLIGYYAKEQLNGE